MKKYAQCVMGLSWKQVKAKLKVAESNKNVRHPLKIFIQGPLLPTQIYKFLVVMKKHSCMNYGRKSDNNTGLVSKLQNFL